MSRLSFKITTTHAKQNLYRQALITGLILYQATFFNAKIVSFCHVNLQLTFSTRREGGAKIFATYRDATLTREPGHSVMLRTIYLELARSRMMQHMRSKQN